MAAGNCLATAAIAASMSCQLMVVSVVADEALSVPAVPPIITCPVMPDAACPAISQIIEYVPSSRPVRSRSLLWPGWMSPLVRPLGWIDTLCTAEPLFTRWSRPPPVGSITMSGANLNSERPTSTGAAVDAAPAPDPAEAPSSAFIAQNAAHRAATATTNASQPSTIRSPPRGAPPSPGGDGGSVGPATGRRSSVIMI